MFRHDIAE